MAESSKATAKLILKKAPPPSSHQKKEIKKEKNPQKAQKDKEDFANCKI